MRSTWRCGIAIKVKPGRIKKQNAAFSFSSFCLTRLNHSWDANEEPPTIGEFLGWIPHLGEGKEGLEVGILTRWGMWAPIWGALDWGIWSEVPAQPQTTLCLENGNLQDIWTGIWTIKYDHVKDMQIGHWLTPNVFGASWRGKFWNEPAGGWKGLKNHVLFLFNVSILIVPLGNRLINGESVFCMEGRITLEKNLNCKHWKIFSRE